MLTRLNLAYITMLGLAFSPWLGHPCMGAFENGFTTLTRKGWYMLDEKVSGASHND